MIKKNGFTLVELLAVIVILAVILVIAVPRIINIIFDAKKSTYEVTAGIILKEVKKQKSIDELNAIPIGKTYIFTDGVSDPVLNLNGDLPTSGEVVIDESGQIKLRLLNSEYCALKRFDEKKIKVYNVDDRKCNYTLDINLTVELAGGSISPRPATVQPANKQLNIAYPTKSGYTFAGWSTTGDATYINGKVLLGEEDTTITANWVKSDVYVKLYDSNSDTIGDTLVFSSTNTVYDTYGTIIDTTYDETNWGDANISISGEWQDNTNITTAIIHDKISPRKTSYWFYKLTNLTTITNLNNIDIYAVSMKYMFNGCSSLTSLTLPEGFGTLATDMRSMFGGCSSLTSLTLPEGFGSSATDMRSMFYYCSSLTSLMLPEGFGTSEVDMSFMFNYCSSLTSLTLPEGFGSSATNMASMFNYCSSLTNLTLPEGFGSSATNMVSMFYYCSSLTSLTLPEGFGSSATNMGSMFYYCSSLTSLTLPEGFGSSATDMSSMFGGCRALTSLTLPEGFGSSATDMRSMFYYCSSLTSLDLTNFDTREVTNMNSMFSYCRNLTTITYGSKFVKGESTTTTSMFNYCSANKPTWWVE